MTAADSGKNSIPVLSIPGTVKHVLLDIEGTTSSIKFVYEVLFPFVRVEIKEFLSKNWNDVKVKHAVDIIAVDAGYVNGADWFARSRVQWSKSDSAHLDQAIVVTEVERLMDNDVKATGLKELQGLIWDVGYEAGALCSHVYPDVPEALRSWTDIGLRVSIYSSGSVAAQKLFFAHTEHGCLSDFLSGYYDTTSGAKREPASYVKIASKIGSPANEILFLSDVPEELDAAKIAGLHVALVVRPGNPPTECAIDSIDSFAHIRMEHASQK